MQRSKLVQIHLAQKELTQLNELKRQMGVKSRPEAIREMLRDEEVLAKLTAYQQAGTVSIHPLICDLITDTPSQRRLKLVVHILGIDSEASKNELQGLSERCNELKQLLNAIAVTQQKAGVNINQIAKQLNAAAKGDTDNIEVWNWALKQLQDLNETNNQLQQDLKNLEKHLSVTKSKGIE